MAGILPSRLGSGNRPTFTPAQQDAVRTDLTSRGKPTLLGGGGLAKPTRPTLLGGGR